MTILSPNNSITVYCPNTNTLTRVVDSKARVVDLKESKVITQVARLSSLDNEAFKQLALIQEELRGAIT